jgi:hypothetical protein
VVEEAELNQPDCKTTPAANSRGGVQEYSIVHLNFIHKS